MHVSVFSRARVCVSTHLCLHLSVCCVCVQTSCLGLGNTHSLTSVLWWQLAGNAPDMTVTVGFPDIRWHQTADYGYVPNPRMKKVFMAVSMDLPDFTSPYGRFVHSAVLGGSGGC